MFLLSNGCWWREGLRCRCIGLVEPSFLARRRFSGEREELYKVPVRRPLGGGRRTSAEDGCTGVCFPEGRTPCGGLLGRPLGPRVGNPLSSPETSRLSSCCLYVE